MLSTKVLVKATLTASMDADEVPGQMSPVCGLVSAGHQNRFGLLVNGWLLS